MISASFRAKTLERAEELRDAAHKGYIGITQNKFFVFLTFKSQEQYSEWRRNVRKNN